MRSQRSYLEGLIDDRDDADDEYWLIRDAVDAVDVYLDCMQSSTLQSVQSLVSISHANSDTWHSVGSRLHVITPLSL